METSIRIFQQGINIAQAVRIVELQGNKLNDEQLERVCSNLRNVYGLGAIPYKRKGEVQSLLVISLRNLNNVKINEGNWVVTLLDNNNNKILNFQNPAERDLLADILVRAVYAKLEKSNKYRRMDTPKIWYDSQVVGQKDDIVGFRRYNVSAFAIENEGIGIGIHVETAFFTSKTVQYYFVNDQVERFNQLTRRQEGARGTLLYRLGNKRLKCYFVDYCNGMTCATTGKLSFNGQTFESLYEYYKQKYPDLPFNPNDKVAKVSFDGNLGNSVPVSANMLFVRVMNDSLPLSLRKLDKIVPYKRKHTEHDFWSAIGETPVSGSYLKIRNTDWKPGPLNHYLLPLPRITFNGGKFIESPAVRNQDTFNNYYQDIKRLLDEVGCFHVPANIPRSIIFPFSKNVPQRLQKRFSDDIVNKVSQLTGKNIKAEPLEYQYYSEVFLQLKSNPGGMVVFTMTDDPAIYYEIESELKRFDIKRITEETLMQQEQYLQKNRVNRWNSFIDLCVYDIIVQMRCIPYSPDLSSYYDGMLAIDVGDKSKFYGVSILINKTEARRPVPYIYSDTYYKADSKIAEQINEHQLQRRIIEACTEIKRRVRFKPLRRLLAVRDGKICGNEYQAILNTHAQLKRLGVMTDDSEIHIIDLHKTSVKEIRLSHTNNGFVNNVLEGTAVVLDNKKLVLSTTGAGTLKLGTANPLMIELRMEGVQNREVAAYLFNTCLFNFFSPTVAQRLPFPVKELDDKLLKKLLQHIPVRG